MYQEEITIYNRDGNFIKGILTLPNKKGSWPLVIGCHELKGTKQQFFQQWEKTLELLLQEGYGIFLFDSTNNAGESFGAFENITVGQEVSDLEDILSFFWTKQYVQKERIVLFAHSLGGMVSLITASESKSISALVLIAPVFNFQVVRSLQIKNEGLQSWKEKGYTFITSTYKSDGFKVNYRFYEEGCAYDMSAIVSKIKAPLLVLHGDQDQRVPLSQSLDLCRYVGGEKDLQIIEGGDHSLKNEEHKKIVANATVTFLNKWLKGK